MNPETEGATTEQITERKKHRDKSTDVTKGRYNVRSLKGHFKKSTLITVKPRNNDDTHTPDINKFAEELRRQRERHSANTSRKRRHRR